MPQLTIDGQLVEVPEGTSVLEAARHAGITIPTLCHRPGKPPLTSCFVCVVRVNGGARLLPSCATPVAEGMVVESETPEVHAARRTALELLLGDHLGDCVGPCQSTCPAHMDIPRMIRQIAAGQVREALITVKERIALPAVLGRICPELCEKACRRGQADAPVSICLLKRHVADLDLASGDPYRPECAPPSGKRVAIVGAGPAGLAAAYYLAQAGHACTLFDEHPLPGGMLQYGVPEALLPRDLLQAEIHLILRLGVEFQGGVRLGESLSLEELRARHDAVLIATGPTAPEAVRALGLEPGRQGIQVDRHTLATTLPGVYAAGAAVLPSRHAVRAVGDGRTAARAIHHYLSGSPEPARDRPFTVQMGRLQADELAPFLANASPDPRVSPTAEAAPPAPQEWGEPDPVAPPASGGLGGLSPDQAVRESRRCLHCDCHKQETCALRRHAIAYGARPNEYRGERRDYRVEQTHPEIVYEPGKCIACGVCVQIATEAREELGLTFIGRGLNVRVAVPLNEALRQGLRRVALACADACPTAALRRKDDGPTPAPGEDTSRREG